MEEKTEITSEPTLLEKTTEMVERLEKANMEHKALIEREETIKANALLGGKSEAGQEPVKPKEETPKEYAARIMRGGV